MKFAAITFSIALMAASVAKAQFSEPDTDAPIDITAETGELVDDVVIFTGNVRAVQDTSILVADRMEADMNDDGQFTRLRASGSVRYSNGEEAITGSRLVFDNIARTITVTDNVIVTQGQQVMSAGAVTYWIDTGKVKFTAAKGKRIRGIFFPNRDGEDQS